MLVRLLRVSTITPPARTYDFEENDQLITLYDRLFVIGYYRDTLVGAATVQLEYEEPEELQLVARGALTLDGSATAVLYGTPKPDCLTATIEGTMYQSRREYDLDCNGVRDSEEAAAP